MPTLADSLVSSSARPLTIRKRPDLQVTSQRYQGRHYWIVKDPVGLNYFRFQEEEFAILNWLDGTSSLDDLRRRFEKQFAPQKIALDELSRLIGMLHQSGLVIANVPGQGKQLLKRRGERKKKQILAALSNVLAIRFKGVDPERFFNWVYPYIRWFFSKPAKIACLFLFFSALTLVLVQFEKFQSRLPGFHEFFGPSNWIWLAAAMGLTKVLHEFGHGLSCKHYGGECHELGVMFLVLTPCLYCNVSDSWMLPNKWQRAFIGAAGMYVEMCLASIATFVWWFSAPGLLNNIALSTMFVCSVSTVVFNGNPLLRYDGYYILSDILEIPNLRQKATTILNRKLGHWCLGLEEPDDPFLPKRHQGLFMLYSVAAAVYSWIVMFSILYFLFKVFEPYRLQVIGQIIAGLSIASLIGRPLWSVGKFFYVPGRTDDVKRPRMYATLAVLGAAVAAILFLPLPYRVYCTLEVQPRDAQQVYIAVPGELTELHVKAGDKVQAGKVLAELKNIDLELAVAGLEAELTQRDVQLTSLNNQKRFEPQVAAQIPPVMKERAAFQQRWEDKQFDVRQLQLVANRDGVVIPPPSHLPPPSPDGRLTGWTGTPLERHNLGATLEPGTHFCQIGDPHDFEAILIIDQADIELVDEGQEVKVMLAELPGTVLTSKITDIARKPMTDLPKHLSNQAGGDVETKTDASGVTRAASTSYQARAPLDDSQVGLVAGAQADGHVGVFVTGLKGQAKIETQYRSLGWRFWRFMQRTFHFKL